MKHFRARVINFISSLFVEDEKDNKVLYPHKFFAGYYISLELNKVYSIKSGKLKELKQSTWKGKTTVTMSHDGKKRTQNMDPKMLRKFVSRNPKNTIELPVVKQ